MCLGNGGLIGGEIRYINKNNDAVIIHSRVCWGVEWVTRGKMGI